MIGSFPYKEVEKIRADLATNAYNFQHQPNNKQAKATIIFDDGWKEDYTIMYPYFQTKGIKGCSAIISGAIGNTDVMTLPQL